MSSHPRTSEHIMPSKTTIAAAVTTTIVILVLSACVNQEPAQPAAASPPPYTAPGRPTNGTEHVQNPSTSATTNLVK